MNPGFRLEPLNPGEFHVGNIARALRDSGLAQESCETPALDLVTGVIIAEDRSVHRVHVVT